jgi:uncharacterized protein (TIGR00725 family)
MKRAPVIAVIGAGEAPPDVVELARAVGREIAARGAVLVCGGRGGVMAAASQGARENGGHTIGILPSYDKDQANPHIEFAIASGMGEARNAIIIGTADAVIALAGEGGTLSEIGLALKLGRPVIALQSWPQLANLYRADTASEAVTNAMNLCGRV